MAPGRRAGPGLLILLAAATAACGTTPPDGAVEVTLDDGTQVASWGEGEYGVVLIADDGEAAADWAVLATEIAANRMMVVALEPSQTDPDGLAAAARWLTDAGVQRIAYLGSGSGGRRIAAAAGGGAAVDQLILVSGKLDDDELGTLGEPPKLFIAAEADGTGASDAERMTDEAAGAWNAVLLVPGSDRGAAILDGEGSDALVEGVIARLEERR
jgi:hypothetical protein